MKDKQFLKNIAVLLVTAAVCVTSGSMFLDQQKPDVLNLDNPNLTGVVKLSDYNENLKGTVNDVDIYVFDSGVPGGKALKDRRNIVITHHTDCDREGVEIVPSPDAAMALLADADTDSLWVIGGGSVYRQMLPMCDTAYVTKVHCTPESDTFFPNLDEDPDWYLAETLQSGEENGVSYEMCQYRRK